MKTIQIKTALQTLAAAAVFAAGAASAEPSVVDDAWLTVRNAPAVRNAPVPSIDHTKHKTATADFWAKQPSAYAQ